MPKPLHHLTVALPAAAVAALLVALPAYAKPCPGADVVPTSATLQRARSATLCLLNQERRAHGLRAVRPNGELRRAAQNYSWEMVHHNFFSHVSPGGSTLLRRVRSTPYLTQPYGWLLGENLAWGSGWKGTPRQTMRAWMRSAGHRHNILTARFTEVGIGIAPGAPVRWSVGSRAATYTTDFGTR